MIRNAAVEGNGHTHEGSSDGDNEGGEYEDESDWSDED